MAIQKVLVIDDDQTFCTSLGTGLEEEGYNVIFTAHGNNIPEMIETSGAQFIILDVMLSGAVDGWQVCREIRKISDLPLMIISRKADTFEKVLAFELGADDYVVKPCDPKEIAARIKAIGRRITSGTPNTSAHQVCYENLTIDMDKFELCIKGVAIPTPPKEIELLYCLASNPNRVYTRDQLLDVVWGFDYCGDSRTVDVHVKRLREKIKGISEKWELKTVWGIGYKFVTQEEG